MAGDIKGESSGHGPIPAGRSREGAPGEEQSSPRLPSLIRNSMSLAGALIAGLTLANILLLSVLPGTGPNPYFGIFIYLLLPAVALIGLLLIPLGTLHERRRRRRLLPKAAAYTQLDLNRVVLGASAFALLVATAGVITTYYSYHFTESNVFCGLTCHVPMKPEWTAYQNSPHARVACVDCHVGQGATYFVRSKLLGIHQLHDVLSTEYPRPIAEPIKNLRPVRAACEKCHWPEKFYGLQYRTFPHTGLDEKNTPTKVRLLIKTGGGGAEFGQPTGIHWHMKIANTVWFVATDQQEQVIPWVKMRNGDGTTVEYVDKSASLTARQIEAMPKRLMDCMTCHSRPSHRFHSPVQATDQAFEAGKLDASLPYLKQQAVRILSRRYSSDDQAIEEIATGLDTYYRSHYPAFYAGKQPQIKAAIAALQAIYRDNFFPLMRVDWRTYPDNIGHLNYPGCFRCHDGNHVSADGRVISNDCESCHTILGPPEADGRAARIRGSVAKEGDSRATEDASLTITRIKFRHPSELEHQNNCASCHKGARL